MRNVSRFAVLTAVMVGAPLATAAAASANTDGTFCNLTTNTVWSFHDSNSPGNQGTVAFSDTKKACPVAKDGADGKDGAKGATGANGAKGDKGDTGAAGGIGLPGSIGPVGPAGPAGPKGETGATGAAGAQGAAGTEGAVGPQGDAGVAGPAGPVGPKGDTGDAGADSTVEGPQGPQGETGAQGVAGDSVIPNIVEFDAASALAANYGCVATGGAVIQLTTTDQSEEGGETVEAVICNGLDGTNGATGANGLNGTNGLNGKDGKAGVNKTVVVNADGTTTTVDGLPHTGASSSQEWAIAGFALALVAGGTAATMVTRRRRSVDA